MSVDIIFQDLPADVDDAREIQADFVPGPIGSRAAVVRAIREAVDVDFTDPEWGHVEGTGFSIEVSIAPSDPVESFAFHVRGDNDREVDQIVADVLARLGIRALDSRRGPRIVDAEGLLRGQSDA